MRPPLENAMLRITTEKKRVKTVLSVEGRLAGPLVSTLEQCWRELKAASPQEKFYVNLCGVSFIDAAGKVLLKEMHRQGGQLVAEGCLNQAIVKEIIGRDKDKGDKASDEGKENKGTPIIFYVILMSLLLGASGVRAQDKPEAPAATQVASEPLKLTLDKAVGLALKQNPTAQIAVLQAAQAVQDKNIARAALLPTADLSVSDAVRRINLQEQLGGAIPFPGIPGHVGPLNVFNAGPTFGAPVFDLTLWNRYRSAREQANASKATSLSTREQVILLVVSQYIGTLRAMATVEASQSRVDLAQALYDQAADLQKEGVGTGIDTLRANVELQNEKQALLVAQTDRDSSLYALSRLLNLDPHQEITLADSLSFFDTPQPDVNASMDEALAARQEWKALDSQVKAAQHDKKASQDLRLPTLRVAGNWAYEGTRLNNGIPVYNYQTSLDVPIFTGGRTHAEIVRADLQLKVLDQQKSDLRNQISLDVKTALLNLKSARNQVEVATLGIQLAKEEVDQARDRFKAGVANNIEVIQAQDALARANDNQIAALYRFNQARADYARSIGQMEKVYAK
jgi:outer membrane protein TolC/ABC-type transporter Mla MlaB component